MVPHCNAIAHERMGSASRGAAIVLAMVIPCHVWRPGGSGPVQARALSPYFWCTIFHLFRSPSLSNGNDACQLETTRLFSKTLLLLNLTAILPVWPEDEAGSGRSGHCLDDFFNR